MIKLTYVWIAKHYGKHVQTIKEKAKKLGGLANPSTTHALLDFYEKKRENKGE